jgi:hypothetical protein
MHADDRELKSKMATYIHVCFAVFCNVCFAFANIRVNGGKKENQKEKATIEYAATRQEQIRAHFQPPPPVSLAS